MKQVDSVKIVGYTFDCKLSWSEMVALKAKKARSRVGALRRLTKFLDRENLKLMYTSFIRPILEYGNIVYCSAAQSHLSKLDRVQSAALKLGGFEVDSLESRRDIAIASYALKMLDGKVKPLVAQFTPTLFEEESSRTKLGGLQVQPLTSSKSLNKFKRSFFGRLPSIWSRLPQDVVRDGAKKGWSKIRRRVKVALSKMPPAAKRLTPSVTARKSVPLIPSVTARKSVLDPPVGVGGLASNTIHKTTLDPYASVFIPGAVAHAPCVRVTDSLGYLCSLERLTAHHQLMQSDLRASLTSVSVDSDPPPLVRRGPRTTLLCPKRVRYSAACYAYKPMNSVQFEPGITASGKECKRCLKLGRLCFQHVEK